MNDLELGVGDRGLHEGEDGVFPTARCRDVRVRSLAVIPAGILSHMSGPEEVTTLVSKERARVLRAPDP